MTGTYVDTSALAKWYLPEAFSEEVEAFLEAHAPVEISTLTVVEMRSLLARRRRAGDIDSLSESRVFATFEADVQQGNLVQHGIEDAHLVAAATLIAEYPAQSLRALDALHLAIARDFGAHTVVTADRVMADASEAMGFEVVRFSG